MHVNRHAKPSGMSPTASMSAMGKEEQKDPAFEGGLRKVVAFAMRRHGMTQTDLEQKTGYSQGYISKWLGGQRGDRGASALFIARIFAALSIDAEVVFKRLLTPQGGPTPPGAKSRIPRPGDGGQA